MGITRGSETLDGLRDIEDIDLEDLTDQEREALEDEAVSTATAAASVEELQAEIAVLAPLVVKAQQIRLSPSYLKWDRLRKCWTIRNRCSMSPVPAAKSSYILHRTQRHPRRPDRAAPEPPGP